MTPALLGTVVPSLGAATMVDRVTFAVAAFIIVLGAIGVVVARNPVHAALMLVMTLFGVAVIFVEQQAHFLAAVQVIVYAGAIVVLFLFVIMFLGVDREEDVAQETLPAQRPLAVLLVAAALAGVLVLAVGARWSVGARSVAGPAQGQPGGGVAALGRAVFTTYLFPFEATAALLVIAVVGAVVLARHPSMARKEAPRATRVGRGATPDERAEETRSTREIADAVAAAVAASVARRVPRDKSSSAESSGSGSGSGSSSGSGSGSGGEDR